MYLNFIDFRVLTCKQCAWVVGRWFHTRGVCNNTKWSSVVSFAQGRVNKTENEIEIKIKNHKLKWLPIMFFETYCYVSSNMYCNTCFSYQNKTSRNSVFEVPITCILWFIFNYCKLPLTHPIKEILEFKPTLSWQNALSKVEINWQTCTVLTHVLINLQDQRVSRNACSPVLYIISHYLCVLQKKCWLKCSEEDEPC